LEIEMGFVMGAAFLAVGVFMITPAGGAIVARKNRETGGTGQGYAPKSTQAARVTGVVVAAIGVLAIVLSAT
jgi:hypothetical protein